MAKLTLSQMARMGGLARARKLSRRRRREIALKANRALNMSRKPAGRKEFADRNGKLFGVPAPGDWSKHKLKTPRGDIPN